ncbi:YceI family protein [Vibrio parahaemolyticus]|nr:YceI family protein [Vibrio parahaemolyticus]ELA7258804.1 YceI family protein [Vibrio parahaemolyticus]EMF1841573.1 YceI family protein [Vibrio parahaemolyticus]
MKFKVNVFAIVLCLFSRYLFASDGYTLDSKVSSVSFATIKSQYVVEPAVFGNLSGSIDENGSFEISIDINSINTGISIRDTRLSDILFESFKYPKVNVVGKVDLNILNEGVQNITVSSDVKFFDKIKTINFPVTVLKSNNYLMVSSSSPVVISLSDFDIPSSNLIELAKTVGGISISSQVPLMLCLSFKK